jgi:16S rRNA processing protein RimM
LRLYVERDRLPETGDREWYEADLIGLAAFDRDGRDWGKVMAFHDFGAGRTMEVSGGSASRHSVMLPFTDAAVPEIDVEGGRVTVDPPAGLLTGGPAKEAGE